VETLRHDFALGGQTFVCRVKCSSTSVPGLEVQTDGTTQDTLDGMNLVCGARFSAGHWKVLMPDDAGTCRCPEFECSSSGAGAKLATVNQVHMQTAHNKVSYKILDVSNV
jgi:hypothetical protein